MTRLRAGRAVEVGRVRLIPIEMTDVRGYTGPGLLAAVGTKEPVALVFRTVDRTWALDLDGREVPADALLHAADGESERGL